MASSANFEAQYGARNGVAKRPPIDPMKTMRPRERAEWQERLGHGNLPGDVDLELTTQRVERDILEWTGHPMPALLTRPSRPARRRCARESS
jgi:hypothetical protein